MRVLKSLATVMGFVCIFAGITTVSALTTSVVHSALYPRTGTVTMMR